MKFGIIGTNWITEAFIDASRQVERADLTAVYSRTEEKAGAFADKHGAAHVFTDLEEMAKSDVMDAVYIASPNSLHYEQALLFMRHNKHVMCEKPIFSNVKELDEAYQVAEENGVFLFEAMRTLHGPNFKELKENLSRVGQIRTVFMHRNKYSSRYNNVLKGEVPNIFSSEFSGGALVDIGVYPLSAAVSLFGFPKEYHYSPSILETGVDGAGTLVLKYPDFSCAIICSKITTSFLDSEINGEKGTITMDDVSSMANVQLTDIHTKQTEKIGIDQVENDMMYEIQAFKRIIETNDKEEYTALTNISREVLAITEDVRKQNGIVYGSEK